MCSGDLEADPPGPAFYNRPTIAADIFTTPLLLNYTSLSRLLLHLKKSFPAESPVLSNIDAIKICQRTFVSELCSSLIGQYITTGRRQ